MKALAEELPLKIGLVFLRLRWGPSQIPVSSLSPTFLAGVLGSAFQVGGSLTMNVFRGYGIHSPLYIPAASVCSKTLILDLLQAQRSVCVFSMSG